MLVTKVKKVTRVIRAKLVKRGQPVIRLIIAARR